MVPSRTLTAAVLVVFLAAGVMAADAAAPVARHSSAPPVYISLGDSLAAGMQPDSKAGEGLPRAADAPPELRRRAHRQLDVGRLELPAA